MKTEVGSGSQKPCAKRRYRAVSVGKFCSEFGELAVRVTRICRRFGAGGARVASASLLRGGLSGGVQDRSRSLSMSRSFAWLHNSSPNSVDVGDARLKPEVDCGDDRWLLLGGGDEHGLRSACGSS